MLLFVWPFLTIIVPIAQGDSFLKDRHPSVEVGPNQIQRAFRDRIQNSKILPMSDRIEPLSGTSNYTMQSHFVPASL
jgi:hypothetical protein